MWLAILAFAGQMWSSFTCQNVSCKWCTQEHSRDFQAKRDHSEKNVNTLSLDASNLRGLPERDSQTYELMIAEGEGRGPGEGTVREFGVAVYTLPYLKWITSKDLLYSTWNSAQCYLAAWMGGEFGGECIHAYVWLRPWAADLKLLQHCLLICYTPIQKKGIKLS